MELNPKYTTVVRYVNTDDKADPPIGYLNINNPAHIPDEQLKSRSYKRVRDMFNTIASGLPSYEVTMIPKGGHLEFTVSLKPHCKPDSDMKWALPCCMSPHETYDLFDQVKLIWMHPYHALRVGRMKMAECQKCRASFANDQLDELVIQRRRPSVSSVFSDPIIKCIDCGHPISIATDIRRIGVPLWHPIAVELRRKKGAFERFADCEVLVALTLSFLDQIPVLFTASMNADIGMFGKFYEMFKRPGMWSIQETHLQFSGPRPPVKLFMSDGSKKVLENYLDVDYSHYRTTMVMIWPPRRSLQLFRTERPDGPTGRAQYYNMVEARRSWTESKCVLAAPKWPNYVHHPHEQHRVPYRLAHPCTKCGRVDTHTAGPSECQVQAQHLRVQGSWTKKRGDPCESLIMGPGQGFCFDHDVMIQLMLDTSAMEFEKVAKSRRDALRKLSRKATSKNRKTSLIVLSDSDSSA